MVDGPEALVLGLGFEDVGDVFNGPFVKGSEHFGRCQGCFVRGEDNV